MPRLPHSRLCLPPPPPPQDHPTTWASPVSRPEYWTPISLPSLTHLCLRLTPPLLPLPLHSYRIPVAAAPLLLLKIFFNVASSCCSAAAFHHHGPRNFPPPSYPVSFALTLNIGQRATHSANAACLLSIYFHCGLVPAPMVYSGLWIFKGLSPVKLKPEELFTNAYIKKYISQNMYVLLLNDYP